MYFFPIVVIFFISLQPQNIFSYLVSKRIIKQTRMNSFFSFNTIEKEKSY